MSTLRKKISAYALIIAISGHNLVAPEHDACLLRDTFIQFGISGDCVRLLAGAQATRGAIIHNLRSISTDPSIMKNIPIIIYFAGHGMRQRIAIQGLGSVNTECILPCDTLATGGQIPPIPDITISALLGEIAKEKGDYITLLLDCCHSGSGSRDAGIDNARIILPEDLKFDQDVLQNEDRAMWSEFLKTNDQEKITQNSRSISTSHPGSFRYQGIRSHVLIAVCRENEESYEFALQGQ